MTVKHTRGMQYQIVLNITFWPETNTVVNCPLVASYDIPGQRQ